MASLGASLGPPVFFVLAGLGEGLYFHAFCWDVGTETCCQLVGFP